MKVLLIGPFGGTDKMYFAPPLGIYRLKSYLVDNGIHCDAVDPTVSDIPNTDDYDIIGYSILAWSADWSLEHAAAVQKRQGQLIVVGGYEATFSYRKIFAKHPYVDAAVLSEGEYALLELAQNPERRDVPGIAWSGAEGKAQDLVLGRTLDVNDFTNLTLNMHYEDIDFPKYWKKNENKIGSDFDPYETRVIRLYVKNRCGFKCDFCSSANFHSAGTGTTPPVLTIEPKDVVDLLVRLKNHFSEVKTFFFQDDEIFAPKTYIVGLLEEIGKRPELQGIRYICQGRIDAIHPSLYHLLKKTNMNTLILGLESFSQNILSELAHGKVVRFKEYSERISKLLEWGLTPFVNIILTTPNASLEDVLYTVDICVKEMERNVEIGMNLYTNNWAGSAMAAMPEYESDGFNFLPFDQELRLLMKRTDDAYNLFLKWGRENFDTLKIKSPSRSVVFVLFINIFMERTEEVERCLKLFEKWPLVPNVAPEKQIEVLRAGIEYAVNNVLEDKKRSLTGRTLMEVI